MGKFEQIVVINGNDLSFEQAVMVAKGLAKVEIEKSVEAKVEENRASILKLAKGDKPIYGFTRGFGQNQDVAVPEEGLIELQKNLIRTHAISFGESTPKEIARMTMLFRANALAKGFSGIRYKLLQSIVDFVNCKDIYPNIPEIGSLGASGDLSPLSHIALALMGEGKCFYKNELIDASEALKKAGLQPVELEAKEGLGLNNGMQWSAAYLAWLVYTLEEKSVMALKNAGMMSEIMFASDLPYIKELHDLRPYPGQWKAAKILQDVFKNSGIRESHESYVYDLNVQDPYSSRCLPQVYGPLFDALKETKEKLTIEMNSATDNPLVVNGQSISGGNFHGMYISIAAANLFNAFCATVSVNMALVRRLVDKDKNRIGVSCLIAPKVNLAISSGMMLLEYSHTAHGNLILSQNSTGFLHAQSSASHQEDHVSHAPTVILSLKNAMNLWQTQLALQAAMIRQGYYVLERFEDIFKKQNKISKDSKLIPGDCGKEFIKKVDKIFPALDKDRFMQEEVERIRKEIVE